MLGLTTNSKPKFQFAGNREKAEGIYNYFKSNGEVNQDLDTWLKGLSENRSYQTRLYEFGKEKGWLDQDFITWRNGLVGKPDSEDITIFGETVDDGGQNTENQANSWSSQNDAIVTQIADLRNNPILYTQADVDAGVAKPNQIGSINVAATNNKIKELQDSAPSIYTFDEDLARSTYVSQREDEVNDYETERSGSLGVTQEGEEVYDSGSMFKDDKSMHKYLLGHWNKKGLLSGRVSIDKLRSVAERVGFDMDKFERLSKASYDTGEGSLARELLLKLEEYMVTKSTGGRQFILQGNMSGYSTGNVPDISKRVNVLDDRDVLTDAEIESRIQLDKERFALWQKGELELDTKELAGIIGIKPEAQKFVDSFFPESLGKDDDVNEIASAAISKAAQNDPRFSLIQSEINENLLKESKNKWSELSEKHDTETQSGLQNAQDEYAEWYNKSFNEALQNNKEATDLFQMYGIAGERALDKRLKEDRDYKPGMKDDYVLNWVDTQLDKYENDDSIHGQVREELAYIAQAFRKIPVTTSEWTNSFEVAVAGGQQRRRQKIVNELNWGLENNKITKDMTLGEARKYVKGLDDRLAWHDWGWTDDDTVGDYLARKEIRKENTENRIQLDLNQREAAIENLNNFVTREVEDGMFDSIEGFGSTLVGGIDQITHMAPRIAGTALMTAGSLATVFSGGAAAPVGAGLFYTGMALSAIGNTVQGAMEYADIYMSALENKMQEKYGEGGFTTEEYLQALNEGLGQHQGAAILGGTGVAASEFAFDVLGSKIGGGGAGLLFKNPAMQSIMKNTLGRYLIRGATMYGEYKLGQVKEGLTEGFQSYLSQATTNMASGYSSPFSRNIDYDQIATEMRAGYKMGGLFGAAGIAGQFKGGLYSADGYVANATKIAENIDMSPDSSTFLTANAYFDQLVEKVNADTKLDPKQKREAIKNISDIRSSTIKVPKTVTGAKKAELINLLIEKKQLENKIKTVGDTDVSANDIARKNAIGQEIQKIVDDANVELALDKNVGNVRRIIHDNSKGKITIDEVADAKEANAFAKSERLKGWNKKFSSNQGTILQDPKTGEQKIIINREQALKDQAVNVASHEFLHGLMFETVKNSPETAINMGNALDSELKKLKVSEDSKYYKRLEQYKDDPEAFTAEEKLTLFSDALAAGDIKFKENIFTSLGDTFRRILQSVGLKGIKFNNGRDVFNFIKDYNNSIEKGELNMAQKKLLSQKAEGDLITDKVIEAKPTQKKSKADAKGLSELVKEYQEGNTDNAGEMFIQYEKVGKDALKRWAAERNVTINLGDPKVNKEVNSLLNSEFPSFAKNFKGDLSEATTYMGNIAKRIGTKIAAEGARKAKQVSTQALEEKGVSPKTTEQKDFDSASRKDTSRKKKYVSSIPAVKNEITENVAKDLVGEVDADGRATGLAKDIIGNIGRNTDPESVAKGIIAGTKDKSVMQTMRELVGKWGSPEYNSFVDNIIDQGLIAAMPVATIKRRLGRQSNIDSGLINYKKIGKIDQIKVKDGKKTYSRPDVYSITKLDKEKLKEYYKETEKRQQSLFSMLTEGILAEGLQTLRNDKGFMNRLATVLDLKKSPLTADEFMDGLEQKLDQRSKEDTSLDEVTVKSAKKSESIRGYKKIGKDARVQIKELGDTDNPLIVGKGKTLSKADQKRRRVTTISSYHNLGKEFHNSATIAGATTYSMYDTIGEANADLNGPLDADMVATLKKQGIPVVVKKDGKTYYDKTKAKSADVKITDKDGKEHSTIKIAQNEQLKYKKWSMSEFMKKINDPVWRQAQINKLKVLKNIAKTIAADLKANPENLAGWTAWLESQASNSRHPLRVLAPIKFFSKIFKGTMVAEHTLPANQVASMILGMAKRNTVNRDFNNIEKDYYQGKITKNQDDKLGKTDDGINLKADMPEIFFDLLNPSTWLRYVEKSVNANKGGINMNTILVWDADGNTQTLTESFGVGLTPSQYNMPNGKVNQNLIQEQNNMLYDMFVKGEPKAEVIKQRLTAKYNLNTQRTKTDIVAKNSKTFGDQIFDKEGTSTAQKQTMLNSLETRVLASKPNRKAKGISIFDFDDTLAKTKEKVIVNNADGTTTEISAAQFAKTADILVEGGASFDFSNFEKVAKGTKKGPLADLALKRQGKFGSGDIFVLTARPQSAAPAIKQFLDSIGLNIPIENITGLADGSAQAKVDFVLNKTAEGYNDFYFADDSIANVEGVKQVLDAVDVKSKTVIAKSSKANNLNKDFEKQIEEVTGVESFKKYSDVRAKLEGKKKDGGFLKRIGKQFTITSSAEDFLGLLYPIIGKGKQGNKHRKFFDDNLITPYNKAEQEVISATMGIARDFENLKKQFPNLKSKGLTNPLMQEIGVGPYTKSQAIRVYMWNKQGMEVPGMSKRDVNALVKAVESDNELNVFADEVMLIGKGDGYPAPSANWLAGNVATDMMQELQKGVRAKFMTQFNENVDAIFTPETMNKLEAIYGSKWREAFEDQLRRMKSGSNRPVYTGGGSRLVNEMLDWLNKAVGTMMFFNVRSGTLQLISNVNFINWGDNNIYNASKAFASKDYWPTVVKLMNSDYLVNRRDGLKINVNEAELADAGKKGGFKGALAYLLDKGFVITRIMDSVAIATGGATFFINRKKALLNRTNPETGKKYTEAEAEVKAFDDFYAIAEDTQQSSNPSKISQQQASLFGRTILSFQNVTMQYNRKAKKMLLDLINRRKRPGMTQLESDLSNVSGVVYYTTMQNIVFNSMQQALFALAFDDATDEEEKEKSAQIINGMLDSLLFGLGFGGAIVSTVKNVGLKIFDESKRKSPDYEEAVWEVFNISPVIDSKVRKLRSAAKTFNWNMDKVKRRGWSLENPAYLAVAQIMSAGFNVPIDRVLQKYNNMAQAMDSETRTWQRIALLMGYSGWNFDLPYWGTQSHLLAEQAEIEEAKQDYKFEAKQLKKKGYKRVPLTGPKSGKPDGKLGVDYIEVERYDGVIEYWINLNR